MTWSPASLRPGERRLAFIAGVVVGCWVLADVVVEPLWHGAADAHRQVTSRTEKLDAVARLLEQAPTIERQYQRYAGFLAEADATSQEALLQDVEALSRRAKLQLNLKPRAGRPGQRRALYEVEVDVEGPQENVLRFLDDVLAMPRLIRVERLRISSISTRSEHVRGNLIIGQLSPQ